MKRRFLICIDNATKEQQNIVTEYFKNHDNTAYWHWFSDLWLFIVYDNKDWTTQFIRDALSTLLPEAHKMVFQLDDGKKWSGFGNPEMFKWVSNTWAD